MSDIVSTAIAITIAAAAWFGGQFLLSLAVRPYRLKLRDGLRYVRSHSKLTKHEAEYLDYLWHTSISVKSTFVLTLVYAQGLIQARNVIEREEAEFARDFANFRKDHRIRDLMDWYFASIFVANPIFGVTALVLRCLWHLKCLYLMSQKPSSERSARCDILLVLPPFETAAKV